MVSALVLGIKTCRPSATVTEDTVPTAATAAETVPEPEGARVVVGLWERGFG